MLKGQRLNVNHFENQSKSHADLDACLRRHDTWYQKSSIPVVIPAKAGIQALYNFVPKVMPLRIVLFNKTKLPRTLPFLELLFSRNR